MAKILRQFVIKKLRLPTAKEIDKDIEWICNSFGFISNRDQEKTAFRILKALIESARDGKGLTSEELAKLVEPTLGSVIYHLKKLIKAGLVVKFDSVYELRMNSLLSTVEEIEKEIGLSVEKIKEIASDIDDKIGLEHR